jgi:UDP-glucose 4-epimerase
MTVLITGGAGYIGSHTAHEFVDAGERVVVLDNLSTGNKQAVPYQTPLIVGDIDDFDLVCNLIRDYHIKNIIHFAGSVVVSESVLDPISYYRNNVVGSLKLIEAAKECGVEYFIFSSSASVYGNPSHINVKENSTIAPISPYGWSKAMTEIMLRDAANGSDVIYGILRYFNVAGADPVMRTGQSGSTPTHLIKVAAQTMLGEQDRLSIFGTDYPTPDGTCIRDYVHVSDLANAHRLVLNTMRKRNRNLTLNCGYGSGHSVREVIAAFEFFLQKPMPLVECDRRPGDPAYLVAAVDAINRIGWEPKYNDLDIIVRHTLEWETQLKRQNNSHNKYRRANMLNQAEDKQFRKARNTEFYKDIASSFRRNNPKEALVLLEQAFPELYGISKFIKEENYENIGLRGPGI